MEHGNQWIAAEIYRFVRAFQQIKVMVRSANSQAAVFVHAPYMLLSIRLLDKADIYQKLKERQRVRLQNVKAARTAASPTLQAVLGRHFYDGSGSEKLTARGRAELKNIQALLQEATDLGLVPSRRDGDPPDGSDMRAWLKKYGIGVDCSGFVMQTLQHLQYTHQAKSPPLSEKATGPELPFLRCPWVYRMLADNTDNRERLFTRVRVPGEVKPGDLLVNRSHMRIVMRAENVGDSGLIFHLAESTSAIDTPLGARKEEGDIGPRIIQVKYAKPDQPVAAQTPSWKSESQAVYQLDENESTYLIGRYRELEAFPAPR